MQHWPNCTKSRQSGKWSILVVFDIQTSETEAWVNSCKRTSVNKRNRIPFKFVQWSVHIGWILGVNDASGFRFLLFQLNWTISASFGDLREFVLLLISSLSQMYSPRSTRKYEFMQSSLSRSYESVHCKTCFIKLSNREPLLTKQLSSQINNYRN